ncbi:MAG: N-acetyltransferase family protein, partial [Rhodoplanes sp.]
MIIRTAGSEDKEAIWRILEPVIRAGETYPLPRDIERDAALAYWLAPRHEVHVAVENSEIVGTYYLCANNAGGGAH